MVRLYTRCAKFHEGILTIVCKGYDSKLTIWAILKQSGIHELDSLLQQGSPTEIMVARQYVS